MLSNDNNLRCDEIDSVSVPLFFAAFTVFFSSRRDRSLALLQSYRQRNLLCSLWFKIRNWAIHELVDGEVEVSKMNLPSITDICILHPRVTLA
jgi:hypothetical protein